MPALWNIDAPNSVQLFDFRNAIGGAPLTNAVITAKLLNHLKTAVIASSSFSIPLVSGNDYGGVSPIQTFDQNTLMWLQITGLVNGTVVYLEHFEVVAGYGPAG
jgi:hypothetical protein